MRSLFFLGPPGSGKGTQARLLSSSLNAHLMGMGDMLRHEIKEKTVVGKKIKDQVESGTLPPWSMVRDVFYTYVKDFSGDLVIFDGIPRTQEQLADVENIITKRQGQVIKAIFLDVPQEELVNRLTNRFHCMLCGHIFAGDKIACLSCGSPEVARRNDDRTEVIEKRLEVYNETISPLIAHYKAKDLLMVIDGTQEIATINNRVHHGLKAIL